ncbi:hypothetical protein GE21DRAFT_7702 [Neurospora crassa]|uniref:Uncharacterized protein n=2 Tax=Neurospora crassa TaxID=5141 RepID=Q7S7G1_NEUCR|nr:hypothetical protein NCU01281 [Neurospora crassa OR74A]EAA31582.1 hypothetical protein NCU01281 [Neurospora crassa OR74A]KHE78941.1 hypothetical protein GE21DRAFT_7702 [Neurospora crassa]CAE76111.1 hypothetical protein [Neurospora crassa]|eukprot:XP_960818.1 hypothetical protein NCU01281 [Neurospora crassa OR74A]
MSSMNKYWIPQLDIHKKVITQELQYYLGPQATVRPFTREGEDGFLITTPGPCLSDEQIDDICVKSKEMWEKQAAARAVGTPNKPLKRPLHQPVVIAQASSDGTESSKRRRDDRRDERRDDRRGDRRWNEQRSRRDDRSWSNERRRD